MASLKDKKLAAQQVRDEYQTTQLARAVLNNRATPILGEPTIHGMVSPNPIVDGTLFKETLDNDIKISLPAWQVSEYDDDDTVTLLWAHGTDPLEKDFKAVATGLVTGGGVTQFPFEDLVISKAIFDDPANGDGTYQVKYQVESYNKELADSPRVQIILDRVAPYKGEEPAPMILPAIINDDYLTEFSDQVIGKIPIYLDWQAGDKVAFYWEPTESLDNLANVLPVGIIEVEKGMTEQPVIFPGEKIRATGNGGIFACYALLDKAHNRSPFIFTPVGVALGALPANFQDPIVKLADDGLIDLKDAIVGVYVEIPKFNNALAKDTLEVTWGTIPLGAYEIGLTTDPFFQVQVPALVLQATYGTHTGSMPTNVSYNVWRGTVPFGGKAIEVDVDFSVIGPVNPDPEWPALVNPDLKTPEVYALNDTLKEHMNEVTDMDFDQPALCFIKLYKPRELDEKIDVYWDDTLAGSYTLLDDDNSNDEITVTIPWAVIEAARNGVISVHYRISGPNSVNEQHSKSIDVSVNAVRIIPEAPTYLGLNPQSGYLTCVSLFEDPLNHSVDETPAVRVQVPDLSEYLSAGDKVTMTWIAYKWNKEPDVKEEITGTKLTEVITLGDDAPVTGFVWRVEPYDKHILPTTGLEGASDGRGEVFYEFDIAAKTATSKIASVRVSMHNPAGYCDLDPKP